MTKHFMPMKIGPVRRCIVRRSLSKTMEDRVDNANVLFEKINFPVNFFIDTMTNQACNAFGALPERLAVILDGKIEFLGGTGPTGYSIPELENHLMKY